MAGASHFLAALAARRSIYQLTNESKLSQDEIVKIVKEAVKWTPTSFNSQTSRAIVIFGAHHEKLWKDITASALKPVVPESGWEATSGKLDSFAAGQGTVLLFEDDDTIKNLQEKFALYAEHFPYWADQSHGSLAINIWTALSEEGVGANLQHYNPLINEAVKKEFSVPEGWRLRAQLVFGGIKAPAGDKDFVSLEERVKVFN